MLLLAYYEVQYFPMKYEYLDIYTAFTFSMGSLHHSMGCFKCSVGCYQYSMDCFRTIWVVVIAVWAVISAVWVVVSTVARWYGKLTVKYSTVQ